MMSSAKTFLPLKRTTTAHSKAFIYVRLTVGIALFVILVRIIDLHQMRLILVSARPEFIALGFLTIMLNFLLKTYRWASILWIQEPNISFGRLIRFNFISMFLANFLPGGISSDIVRCYQISKYTSQIRSAISSVIVDRMVGSFSTATIAILSFIALQQIEAFKIGPLLSYGIFTFLLLSVGMPLVLQSTHLMAGVKRLLGLLTRVNLLKKVLVIYENFGLYHRKPGTMLKALSISFLNLAVAALEFYAVAVGFSSGVSVGYYLMFVPLAIFLSMLPLSWGGIGILEVSMVFFFSKVGMPVEMCLSIVMVRRVLFLLSTIPGGMFYMLEGFPVRKVSV